MTESEKPPEQLSHEKVMAETGKLNAESSKISKEAKWYEITIAIAGTLAVVAITKLFL